jgi:hypothetical protein
MENQKTKKLKVIFVGIVTILIFGFLLWEHFNGGVTSHYLLQQKDLPSISNWWSGLLLPMLTWILLSRVERRFDKKNLPIQAMSNSTNRTFWFFLTGLGLGLLLAISFTYEFNPFLDNMLYILIVLSFFIPIYFSEFILGFILGMTYTFGAIIPTLFILMIAGIGLLIYRFIRPLIFRLSNRLRKKF